jgi:hypothetical protein
MYFAVVGLGVGDEVGLEVGLLVGAVHVLELASQVSSVPEHTDVPQRHGTVVAAAVPSVVLHWVFLTITVRIRESA